MIHLHGETYITADEYSYSFAERSTIKTGEHKGEDRFVPFSHHSTPEQVGRKIRDLGMKEITAHGDWSMAMDVFTTMLKHFEKGLPKLLKQRDGTV